MNDGEELSCFKSSSQLMAGILVAISIPIFTAQLEKSRDAVTLANLRSAYAEAQASYLTETAANDNVEITKGTTSKVVETIAVKNVQSKGTVANGVSDCSDLPFPATNLTAMDNTPGNYTVTFTYDAKGKITAVSATAA